MALSAPKIDGQPEKKKEPDKPEAKTTPKKKRGKDKA